MNNSEKKEKIIQALRGIDDPELHIDIYTLGLIYDISEVGEGVRVLMTLTTPLCPYADAIVASVKEACLPHAKLVEVTVTFTPLWQVPEELRAVLGI